MSNIAEQKALEAYPIKHIVLPFNFSIPDLNEPYRKPYQEGYDQAMQAFMEKAEEFLYLQLNNGSIECGNIEKLIEQFINYMQDESN